MKKSDLLEQVKKLRQETGAGVMMCKKALEETGDYQKAKEWIKKKGVEKAEEKKERETKEGYVATYTHATGKIGVVVELLCETDFVSRNQEFRQLAQEICLQVAAMNPKDKKELLAQEYIREPGKTIETLLKEAVAKFGENIQIGDFARLEI
ncbi:translation elongation factor Ts [bacterium]|nr:translation elongation factor Ts [bacterium]